MKEIETRLLLGVASTKHKARVARTPMRATLFHFPKYLFDNIHENGIVVHVFGILTKYSGILERKFFVYENFI